MRTNAEGYKIVIVNRILKQSEVKKYVQSKRFSLDLVKVPSLRSHKKDILQFNYVNEDDLVQNVAQL